MNVVAIGKTQQGEGSRKRKIGRRLSIYCPSGYAIRGCFLVICVLLPIPTSVSLQDIHPFVNADRKREPSDYPALAAFDIKVDRKSKFPVLLLAIATFCRTIANARLRSELTKGCTLTSVSIH